MHLGSIVVVALAFQTPHSHGVPVPAATAAAVVAVRATSAVRIDGRDDDPVWHAAPVITAFREYQPVEGGEPRLPTQAKVAYDTRNLYVFVRAYDPHPDSIVKLLSRRDVEPASDLIRIFIDSYHDRRTGYEFAVNPAGVKLDYAISNDGDEDIAWDGVWDAAARVDSLGWTAEFRIPLSQLRYKTAASDTFGFAVARRIKRYTEDVSWPAYHVSRAGLVSQFGVVTGLDGLPSPRRVTVIPYLVAKNLSVPAGTSFGRRRDITAGGDLERDVASNWHLNATVNPDFGQVEADPAVLNLTAFETFLQERRPFFVEGTGLFRFDVNCNAVSCNGESVFYSRRIGRAPELSDRYADATAPTATTILGAAKLTGRAAGGLSLGLLGAVTGRATGEGGATIEPATYYVVMRARQEYEYRGSDSDVGVLLTAVNRVLDRWTEPYLHRSAYVGAGDFRHRAASGRYELSGSFDLSWLAGSPEAIAATQLDAVHYYQRPDGVLTFDSTRRALVGDAEELKLAKIGGEHTRFQISCQRRSPGFEINDLGFLLRADEQSWSNWFGFRFTRPWAFYQQAFWNLSWWQQWSTAGLATERGANTNVQVQLNSRWWVQAGGSAGHLGATYCDRCTRGGPAVRVDRYLAPWVGVQGDDRRALVPNLWVNYWRTDRGRTESITLSPYVELRLTARLTTSLGLALAHNRDNTQWFGNFTDSTGVTRYTFVHLDQNTAGITWRLNGTLTPNVSLQVYAQPFVSKGAYADVRELAAPKAADYAARYRPYADTAVANHPAGFDVRQFRSNVVFRWEYHRGSTLFLVWTQGRQDFTPTVGPNSFARDFADLFTLHPDNTFLVKASYALSW